MTKKTTSDRLKEVFAQFGGKEGDWKRLSKKKNEGGQWERVFENKSDGAQIVVTELEDGKFDAHVLGAGDIEIELPAAANTASATIEADPDENAAADQVVDMLVNPLNYDEEGADEKLDELVKAAGKTLASHFCFAITEDETFGTGFSVYVCPLKDKHYDQHLEHVIEHLMPAMSEPGMTREEMEATFSFMDYNDPVKLKADLEMCGFIWDEQMQRNFDKDAENPIIPRLSSQPNTLKGPKAP
jgi:hypothetical protein